ncbi:unnamed protein product [Coccothraustes coccothraustes]
MLQAFRYRQISAYSILAADAKQAAGQGRATRSYLNFQYFYLFKNERESLRVCYCPFYQEGLCQKYQFFKWMKLCFWRKCFLGILPTVFLTVTAIMLILHYSLSPAFSFIYICGIVEILNLTYTNDLNDATSQKFILQANTIQNM